MRKSTTVSALASELELETDDVLIMLWDVGISYPTTPGSVIKPQDVPRSLRACGSATAKDLIRVEFWLKALAIERGAFTELLLDLGVHLGPNARTLPRGAVAKLKRSKVGRKALRTSQSSPPETAQVAGMQAFVWRTVGKERDVKHLSKEEVIDIHFALENDFRGTYDPISPAGVRDRGLLESAVLRPATSHGSQSKYVSVEMAGAALMQSLVHNHAFYNGNKRTALVSLLSLLDRNGLVLQSSQDELFKWTVRVAQHKVSNSKLIGDRHDIEVTAMADWIQHNSRLLDKGEKVINWMFLRRRLAAFDCTVEATGNRGGRMSISRVLESRERSMFGVPRTAIRQLHSQIAYGGEGRDIGKSEIKRLRRELELDEDHGYDSAMFYGASVPPDQFISDYRKTLTRLAKV